MSAPTCTRSSLSASSLPVFLLCHLMGEVVNVIVAFAVIVFIVRWATTNKEQPNSPASVLGFRPKNVNDEMIDTIHNMFPNIPRPNIHYSLLRTGSVQVTSNTILEKGFLDHPPPAYFTLYTQQQQPQPTTLQPVNQRTASSTSVKKSEESLITRYKLESRLSSSVAGPGESGLAGGKAAWEPTAEAREKSLQERKAQMILAARKRWLEQQEQSQSQVTKSSKS